MIMPAKKPDKYKKLFAKILKTARPLWHQFNGNKQTKTAQGLLEAGDTARTADLSYNDKKHQLDLELRLKPSSCPDIVKERLMLSQDRWAHLLASVTFEKEDRILRVRAKTILDPAQNPDCPVRAIFEDLKSIVNDSCFQQLLY